MPTRRFNVTNTPQDMCSGLSLSDEREYLVEVVSGHQPIRLWESIAAPTDLSAFHTIPPGVPWSITCHAGWRIWIWCPPTASGSLVEALVPAADGSPPRPDRRLCAPCAADQSARGKAHRARRAMPGRA